MRRPYPLPLVVSFTVVVLLLAAGCSSDPTQSDEYVALEQELAQTESQLVQVTAERDELEAVVSKAPQGERNRTEPPPEVADVADAYFATWTDVDSDAFFDLVTDDYVFEWDTQSWTAEEKMAEIRWYEFAKFRVEFTSERLWSGEVPRYFMSQSHLNYTDSGFPGPEGVESISVLEIADRGGEYLVARHFFYR